nr:MerR family transcriptional regulator [Treponema sp.]
MTKEEILEKYGIPPDVLEEYHQWDLCEEVKRVMGAWQYDDTDLDRLSLILTLHDLGFDREEIERYMRLYLAGAETERERLSIIEKKRKATLGEIHLKEKQLERMDYLRGKLRKG